MKSNSKRFGALLAVAVLTTTVMQAQDKPATPSTPAPAAAAAPATPAASKLDDLFPDPVIAKGKNFEIKRSRLDEAIAGMRAAAAQRGRELMPSDLPMIEKTAFDRLLQVQVLKGGATDADMVKAKETTDKRYATILKRAGTEEALVKQLKTMSMTLDDFRSRLLEEALAEQVLHDKVTVADAAIQKFYDDNPTQFEQPEMVRASHILISTVDKSQAPLSEDEKKAKRKIAEGLLKRARDGEDFTKLAKEFSEDPGVKENAGEYTFRKGQMVPEFEAAAFSLQTNQISDLVMTKYGYHIIKLSEKIPAKKIEFAKVSPEIKTYLENQEMEKVLPEIYGKLKKDADVKIVDEQLKALEESTPDTSATPAKPAVSPVAPTTK